MNSRKFIEAFLKGHRVANWDHYVEQLNYGPVDEDVCLVETSAREVLRINKIRHSRPTGPQTIGRAELIHKLENLGSETLLQSRAFFTPQGGLHLYTDKEDNFVGMLVLWSEKFPEP